MNKITMKTSKGTTTLNLKYVSAYTVSKVKGSRLASTRYVIDLHMNSGTIFSSEVSEADYIVFEKKWSEK
tara:strand:+ start:3025 stop:3234 length:210 start_codon:yes stop_codon:yes gene_type:complete